VRQCPGWMGDTPHTFVGLRPLTRFVMTFQGEQHRLAALPHPRFHREMPSRTYRCPTGGRACQRAAFALRAPLRPLHRRRARMAIHEHAADARDVQRRRHKGGVAQHVSIVGHHGAHCRLQSVPVIVPSCMLSVGADATSSPHQSSLRRDVRMPTSHGGSSARARYSPQAPCDRVLVAHRTSSHELPPCITRRVPGTKTNDSKSSGRG
jgi:hypothetical protein